MANGAGIRDRLTTHAIRRGALRDITHILASAINVQDRTIAAAVARHSVGSQTTTMSEMCNELPQSPCGASSISKADDLAPARTSGSTIRQNTRSVDISRFM